MAPALAGRNVAAIHLGRMSPCASRDQPGRQAETALRVAPRAIPIRSCSRWGLPCRSCCQGRGGLLPHPFTLAPPIYRPVCWAAPMQWGRYTGGAVCFLWHFPWGRPRRTLSGTVFHGARTFLPACISVQLSRKCRYKGIEILAGRPPGQLTRRIKYRRREIANEKTIRPTPRAAASPGGGAASCASRHRRGRRCAPAESASGRLRRRSRSAGRRRR